jgi:thioredoxin 1|tara:strand:+ start:1822 stop:2139 length:318 start_codon:yes stop_codon:yes gene_type:complete
MAIVTSTDDMFEDEIMKSPSAVVQFSATWCGPCQALKPIMEKVSDEMSDKFKFYYHDIDSAPNSPTKFGVRGVPTVMIFKNGKLLATKVGSVPESTMKTWLAENA